MSKSLIALYLAAAAFFAISAYGHFYEETYSFEAHGMSCIVNVERGTQAMFCAAKQAKSKP